MPISGQGHIAVHPSAAQLATRVRALNRPVVTVSFGVLLVLRERWLGGLTRAGQA